MTGKYLQQRSHSNSIIYISNLQNDRRVNGKYYANLLNRFNDFNKIQLNFTQKKVLVYQNYAGLNMSIVVNVKIK